RVIADSKENYIPITVGINYSLPMGNSGFGFTMGVDAGAWVHNISRSYYFMGGNAPTYHFTETTISHYSDNKTIFNYAMGSGSVAVNQTATEMKEHFNSHDIQTLNFTQQGSVSMLYNVPLEAYKTFVYNSNTNAILFGYINPTNSALPTSTILYPQSGNGNEYPIINFDNSSHPFYNANSSYLQEIKPGTINLSGLIYLGHVIFLDGKTPTFTTVAISSLSTVPMYYFNAIGSSNISGTFTSSTLAVSHLSTTGFGTGTITSGRTVAVGISAVITSTAAVAAGGSVTTLLGSNVALANNSFTTETATVRMLGSSSTSIISSVNGVAVGAVNTVIKMDQAMQVKGVIIPKISFNWSPLDNLTFT
ncbi:MAG: hypothetical protein ORN57_05245, partial [Alphaproteobacteria bacterium]|nr:hypothetical protein [Alphaproteobacteria bacterium]